MYTVFPNTLYWVSQSTYEQTAQDCLTTEVCNLKVSPVQTEKSNLEPETMQRDCKPAPSKWGSEWMSQNWEIVSLKERIKNTLFLKVPLEMKNKIAEMKILMAIMEDKIEITAQKI